MTDATTAAAARALIDRSQYMTDARHRGRRGTSVASPVWFAHHQDYTQFLWVSRPDARHSQNIEARPAMALVILDSTVAPREAQAVYVEAEAEQVGADVLDRVVGAYSDKSFGSGLKAWSAADVSGAAPHRLYRASALASFVLAAHDRRVPVSLPTTTR